MILCPSTFPLRKTTQERLSPQYFRVLKYAKIRMPLHLVGETIEKTRRDGQTGAADARHLRRCQ
ncbi:hypothetical protein MESS2_10055 [Mesorhizobium metallidurans STM 2683]|uniref:Uncharacterized protein n=1 Tax=Mesorhizobium metallidurans STM 2683 TaxID=1297569 RepID=M5EE94_9HYPH|nr:hypothetical protein MESS2_10055 [Mesorhizobium metallidurans STM 2683]